MAVKHKTRAKKFQSPGHYTKADREKIKHFAGPHESFPIEVPQDVADAARLVGHAGNPEAVKRNIIRIAHQLGPDFVAKLPDAWTSDQGERMDTPTLPADDAALDPLALLQRAQDTYTELADALGYDPLTLLRRAKASEEDEDEEDDDSDEEESDGEDEDEEEDEAPPPPPAKKKAKRADAPEPALTRAVSVKAFTTPNLSELVYIPITRRDDTKREIEGVLSNEQIDTFGTIFDYDSMKRAVNDRWHGNVREQHDPKKAVGKGVFVSCDDDNRQVTVRARISTGAEDTWQKILDGVLCGFSIGAANAKTENRMVKTEQGDRSVTCYKDFDLAEISVVDAPSNPGAARSGLTIYRSATAVQADEDIYADVLAPDEVESPTTTEAPSTPAATDASPVSPAPTTPSETVERAQAADAPAAPPQVVATPDPILTRAELGDTMSGQPTLSSGPELDHDAINSAMNGDTGYTHVHAHAYDETTAHANDHTHEHQDGTAHKHPHSHGHVGSGDGSRPHVHLHEHGHQYRVAASDLQRTQDGAWRTPDAAFVGQDDPRLAQYLPTQERAQAPAVLPAPAVETNGKSIDMQLDAAQVAQHAQPEIADLRVNRLLAGANASVQAPDATRRGARVSDATRAKMHDTIKSMCQNCTGDKGECPHCNAVLAVLDPDHDGDDDLDSTLDSDHDMAGRVQKAQLTRAVSSIVTAEIHRALAPILTQQRQITARLAGVQMPEFARVTEQLDTVSAVLTALQDRVQKDSELLARIAEQEQPGAPVVRAMEKSLPGQALPGGHDWTTQDVATLRKAALRGVLSPQEQTQAAAQIIAQQAGLR